MWPTARSRRRRARLPHDAPARHRARAGVRAQLRAARAGHRSARARLAGVRCRRGPRRRSQRPWRCVAVWRWHRTTIVVTTEKLFVVHGTVRRRAAAVRLTRVGAIELEQTLLGRLLGYGTLCAGELGDRLHPGAAAGLQPGRPAQRLAESFVPERYGHRTGRASSRKAWACLRRGPRRPSTRAARCAGRRRTPSCTSSRGGSRSARARRCAARG